VTFVTKFEFKLTQINKAIVNVFSIEFIAFFSYFHTDFRGVVYQALSVLCILQLIMSFLNVIKISIETKLHF